VRNEITKFGANPTSFESLIADLKITDLVPQNLKRFLVLLSLASHVEGCVLHSLWMEAKAYLICFLGINLNHSFAYKSNDAHALNIGVAFVRQNAYST
jgi:hypothetical protein